LRRRQIARLDQAAHAWPVGAPIAERGATLENAGRRLRQERHGRETKHAGKARAKQWIKPTAHEVSRKKLAQSR
jgi:hypothetical protein